MYLMSEISIKIAWQIVVKFCGWLKRTLFPFPLSPRAGVVHVIRGPPLHCRSPFLESSQMPNNQGTHQPPER